MKNLYKIENELYIISNTENVNENCWIITEGRLVQVSYLLSDEVAKGNKVILTTNKLLIQDGVQAINDEFLKWFVKSPSCESVDVNKICNNCGDINCIHAICHSQIAKTKGNTYKIIIPKEEPKQETLKEQIVGYRLKSHINRVMIDSILKNAMPIWNDNDKSVYFIRGHVAGSLVAKLKELQVLDLWFTPIYESEEVESDWVKEHHLEYYYKKSIMSDKSKQETLEEAAKLWNESFEEYDEFVIRHNRNIQNSFIEGAKWQQERMYSEEEVNQIAKDSYEMGRKGILIGVFNKWFNEYKKK